MAFEIVITRWFWWEKTHLHTVDSEREEAAKVNSQPDTNANSRINQNKTANLQYSEVWSKLCLFWTWTQKHESGWHFAALIIYKDLHFLRIVNSRFTTMRIKENHLKFLIHTKSSYVNFYKAAVFLNFLIWRLLPVLYYLASFNPFQKYQCSMKHCCWSH